MHIASDLAKEASVVLTAAACTGGRRVSRPMLTNPQQALEEYDLSNEERSILDSRDRDLIELMRIGGEGGQSNFLFLFLDIALVIDLTEFITTLHLDITIDLAEPGAERRQELNRERIASLAESVRSMRTGADRLERIRKCCKR